MMKWKPPQLRGLSDKENRPGSRVDLLQDAIKRSRALYAEEQEKLCLNLFMICDIKKLGDDE